MYAERECAAVYIAELTVQLEKIAQNNELETLAYMLSIARLEATTFVQTLAALEKAVHSSPAHTTGPSHIAFD